MTSAGWRRLLPHLVLLDFLARLIAFHAAVRLVEDVVENILFVHLDGRTGAQARYILGLVRQQANDRTALPRANFHPHPFSAAARSFERSLQEQGFARLKAGVEFVA